jgi:fructose-1,6-bisphosphatase I
MKIGISFKDFVDKHDNTFDNLEGIEDIYKSLIAASIEISTQVNKAGIIQITGQANKENVQGEDVMMLDEIANDLIIDELKKNPFCAGLASEELEEYTAFEAKSAQTQYVVLFDPLDGSSNIDTCASIGTIFSIYKKVSNGSLNLIDFLQSGREIVSAGYIIYGSSTILVYSAGDGVHGFTLDIESNQFLLSHPNIQTPNKAKWYSLNLGGYNSFDQRLKNFIKWTNDEDKSTNRPLSIRYIGTMVADFHRNLLKGGVFIYPATSSSPNGKLRLMYECIPLAYIQEQAGGKSTDGTQSILSIEPSELHQRTPIAIGSNYLVDHYIAS